MNMLQALATKDQMTKQALYDVFANDDDAIRLIDLALAKGESSWMRHLTAMFGLKEVNEFMSSLKKDAKHAVNETVSTPERA